MLLGIMYQMSDYRYILGYGLLYIFGFYILSWIVVPLLLLFNIFLSKKIGVLGSFLVNLILVVLISYYGYDTLDIKQNDQTRFFTEIATSPLFVWLLYTLRELD